MSDPTSITVPRPHVPYGPERVPANDADVNYLREAAHRIEGGYRMGSNLTATVVKLLHDAADAIKAGSAAPTVALDRRLADRRQPGEPGYDAFYDATDGELAAMVPPAEGQPVT